jgi:hypothetical protein
MTMLEVVAFREIALKVVEADQQLLQVALSVPVRPTSLSSLNRFFPFRPPSCWLVHAGEPGEVLWQQCDAFLTVQDRALNN